MTRQVDCTKVGKKKWVTRKANWELFVDHLNNWYKSYHLPHSVQLFSDELTRAIQDAADHTISRQGKFNHGRKHIWYYDNRVKFLTKVTHQLTRIYKRSRSYGDKVNFQEWTTYTREQINIIREEKWLQYTGRFNHTTSMTQVWKTVNHIRGRHTHPPVNPDPAMKAHQLMRNYHERAATDSLPVRLQERKAELDPARLDDVTAATLLPDDTDHPITRKEQFAARKESRDTVPGEDGITYSMLNAVCLVKG